MHMLCGRPFEIAPRLWGSCSQPADHDGNCGHRDAVLHTMQAA